MTFDENGFYKSDYTKPFRTLCKLCKEKRYETNKSRYLENSRKKYASNKEFRERRQKASKEYSARPGYKLKRRLKRIDATLEEYQIALDRCKGLCEICESNPATECDHEKGKKGLRGLLCIGCNTALGLLKEDPARILKLLNYKNTRSKG